MAQKQSQSLIFYNSSAKAYTIHVNIRQSESNSAASPNSYRWQTLTACNQSAAKCYGVL